MKFFLVVTMCMQACYSGYIEKPFDDQLACQAYGTVYASVLTKNAPDSHGQLHCVPEDMMEDLKKEITLGKMKPLEELAPSK